MAKRRTQPPQSHTTPAPATPTWSLPPSRDSVSLPERAPESATSAPTTASQDLDQATLEQAPRGHDFANISLFYTPESAPPTPPQTPPTPPADGGGFPVQASLRVNTPGDVYEQEADRMAEQVMRMQAGPDAVAEPSTVLDASSSIQRAPGDDTRGRFGHDFASIRLYGSDWAAETGGEASVMRSPAGPDQEPMERSIGPDMPAYYIQRAPGSAGLDVSPQVEGNISQMQGGGQPLPSSERSFFENRFGHDFSQIRIHADDHAAQTSRALNARAFTVGTDIAFDSGEYQPGTESGRHLLAHELTHTIQQTGGVAMKRVQRKAADEETEAVPAPEEAPAEKSPVDLVAEAAQTLTDGEVAKQAVPPIEAQPVELPEHKPEDAGGSAGGGGGGGEAAAPAPAPQQAVPALAAADQNAAAASAKAPAAPTPVAVVPAGAAAVETAPTPKPAEAVPAPAPAAAEASSAAPAPETKAPTPTLEAKSTAGEAASPTRGNAPAAEANGPVGEAAGATTQAAPAAETKAPGAEAHTEEQAEPEAGETETKPANGAPGAAPERAAAAPGAPDAAADDAGEPNDEKKRIQRMPAGQVIQRAPRSPEADPAFQAVTSSVKNTATEQKQHAPGQQKATEAAAAAKMPQEEKLGAAQNTQTTAIDAAAQTQEQAAAGGRTPGFDKAAFKASVKARIDELTPKDPKQMENIEGSGVFGDVKSAVDQKVETGKDQAQGNVDDKVKEAPNPGAVPDKPTTALQPNTAGQAPGQLDASGAAPKAKGAEEVEQPLQAQSQQLDQQMASAQITPEQLQNSNEPTFQAALQAKTGAQEHVQQALPQYRTKEQGQIQGAQQEAGTLAQTGLGAMFTSRTGSFGQMDTLQNSAKGQDEQKRAEIGRQIDGIFQRTKTDVEGILTALDTQVDQAFTSGADAAKSAAIAYIKRETDAYKEKRYASDKSLLDVGAQWDGLMNRGHDAFMGMPNEYYEYYRQGRDLYVAEMDKVLDQVATIVGDHLGRAHQRVQQGRDEIQKFVESQPEELREVAQQAAQDAESKFGELEQTIDSKQSEIVDSLAQKYVEKLQALDSELEQMKEAEKGLLAKAGDMINGVIKTITELKDLLLSTLQRAAGAVMKILENPIGFLGNLLSAVGQGLRQFVGNIGTHLKEGLISWLTGALTAGGIQLPTSWDLQGIFSLVMQILGLTYQQIRVQIIKALGPIGETVIGALEQAWEVFQIIQNEGLAGLWKFIQEQVGNLQAMVMDQIRDMVIGQVIKAGIDWLIGILGGPAGAFIKAVQAIVRVVSWFVENAGRMASLVNSIIDSVMAIANGDIGGAANHVEQSLAKAVPTVITFLADLLGLGGISHKVQEIIGKVKAPIQKGIDWLVQKAVALGKKLFSLMKGKDKTTNNTPDNQETEQSKDVRAKVEAELRSRIGSETPDAETIQEAIDATFNKYQPEGLKALEIRPVGNSIGEFEILAEASPLKRIHKFRLRDININYPNHRTTALHASINGQSLGVFRNGGLKHAEKNFVNHMNDTWNKYIEMGYILSGSNPEITDDLTISITRSPCGRLGYKCGELLHKFVQSKKKLGYNISMDLRIMSVYGGEENTTSVKVLETLNRRGYGLSELSLQKIVSESLYDDVKDGPLPQEVQDLINEKVTEVRIVLNDIALKKRRR